MLFLYGDFEGILASSLSLLRKLFFFNFHSLMNCSFFPLDSRIQWGIGIQIPVGYAVILASTPYELFVGIGNPYACFPGNLYLLVLPTK